MGNALLNLGEGLGKLRSLREENRGLRKRVLFHDHSLDELARNKKRRPAPSSFVLRAICSGRSRAKKMSWPGLAEMVRIAVAHRLLFFTFRRPSHVDQLYGAVPARRLQLV